MRVKILDTEKNSRNDMYEKRENCSRDILSFPNMIVLRTWLINLSLPHRVL